jgi:hypothetical protein
LAKQDPTAARRLLVAQVRDLATGVGLAIRSARALNLPVEPGVSEGREALVRWADLLGGGDPVIAAASQAGATEQTAECAADRHHLCRGMIVSLTAAHGRSCGCLPRRPSHHRRDRARSRLAARRRRPAVRGVAVGRPPTVTNAEP